VCGTFSEIVFWDGKKQRGRQWGGTEEQIVRPSRGVAGNVEIFNIPLQRPGCFSLTRRSYLAAMSQSPHYAPAFYTTSTDPHGTPTTAVPRADSPHQGFAIQMLH
jgi:hypothetical protein